MELPRTVYILFCVANAISMSLSSPNSTLGYAVRHVHLSKQGMPQVLLSNRSAWLYHMDLRCWMCLADPAFSASPFTSLLPLTTTLQGQPFCVTPCISLLACRPAALMA